jgi:hypothetical protein
MSARPRARMPLARDSFQIEQDVSPNSLKLLADALPSFASKSTASSDVALHFSVTLAK